jgi:hypothetical protein
MTDGYAGRVTVDIDGYTPGFETVATRAYYNLADAAAEVEVHISSSGEGIHLVGWFEDDLGLADRLKLRRYLSDDPNRIRIDIERARNGVYTGVLWSEKNANTGPTRDDSKATETGRKDRSFADIHAALRHMEMTNTDPADRVQRLAEHGHKGAPELARHARGDPQ